MKLVQRFIQSAGALLLAAALAAWLGSLAGVGYLHPHDPLLGVSMPILFWIFGGLAFALAWFCLLGRNASFQLALLLWFVSILIIYQIGVHWQSGGGFQTYLLPIAVAFAAVSPSLVNALLQALTLYLLLGAGVCLCWLWYARSPRALAAAARFQNMACPACGGHIRFASQNAGQPVPCPHCQTVITLHKPENLKMSCFFCQGHIEFPAHALGEKMPCPHCHMDITLKEPK